MSIGANIKYLRKKNKLKQVELAELIGVYDTHISKWESNKIEPPLSKMRALSDYFNVSLDLLANGDPKDFNAQNYYGITDYGIEARKIFHVLDPEEQDELLRTMYEFRIRHNRKNRRETAFTQQQQAVTLLFSENIVLKEFGKYIQRYLETYDEVRDPVTKQLLIDTTMYLSEGKEQSNDFVTLIRNMIEKIFPISSFQFAYTKDNLTIEKMSQQFKLDPDFLVYALNYYIETKGTIFTFKDLTINLSALALPDNESIKNTKISILPK
ncbi:MULTISPECIES: helix-turn-helix domain-containing protein [unclassified Enterococcus]|uniref:helix-turn-helix domain-containing protein n=1 Tax=unclassified Enterococcus TaxID=2608891 RepID=UPI001CE07072|nr:MULTISPECIES: helix-turn-helix transcriptional regulator [unclassified Enterococcus]MCA5014538.1 helix-turn-helix transcriptional regulator [Enterococcus sp. S23]MCA5017791.1 helix-turn-helix transcriptional regulator [Enterococcus sp. S22(2020)]